MAVRQTADENTDKLVAHESRSMWGHNAFDFDTWRVARFSFDLAYASDDGKSMLASTFSPLFHDGSSATFKSSHAGQLRKNSHKTPFSVRTRGARNLDAIAVRSTARVCQSSETFCRSKVGRLHDRLSFYM